MGNFNIQQFRKAAVLCLLDSDLLMELLTRLLFREMIGFTNLEVEAALWASPRGVATYAMCLFHCIQHRVVHVLSTAVSKICISFDGWTTKSGKCGFFGVVAHFANACGVIQDSPIDLPQLVGADTGKAIAETIVQTLEAYSITGEKLGYFELDNAADNNTAIAGVARAFYFNEAYRRLRCGSYLLDLVSQATIFGADKEAYDNVAEQLDTEEVYMQEKRKQGPLGVLVDVINYIKTPQQYELFRGFQRAANTELPAGELLKVLGAR
ncbi:hypothetical protein AG0111_0g11766 [Alternaria gaisen]|uniref:Uncharacterized protein n=1 Tax=Alternaria gaisen TaxID=167740 RepID=A0ACB6F6G2_9PLEO|nr:hypothetical protein AG0111_0g11766 [Alternaria gaisen]